MQILKPIDSKELYTKITDGWWVRRLSWDKSIGYINASTCPDFALTLEDLFAEDWVGYKNTRTILKQDCSFFEAVALASTQSGEIEFYRKHWAVALICNDGQIAWNSDGDHSDLLYLESINATDWVVTKIYSL